MNFLEKGSGEGTLCNEIGRKISKFYEKLRKFIIYSSTVDQFTVQHWLEYLLDRFCSNFEARTAVNMILTEFLPRMNEDFLAVRSETSESITNHVTAIGAKNICETFIISTSLLYGPV